MARVLYVGLDPETVDFSDPALPPGLDAEKIRRGIRLGVEALRADGHEAEYRDIPSDPAELGILAGWLAVEPVDCVIVGGGVRVLPRNLELFEAVLNTIARADSRPAIALIGKPDDVSAAVARVLG